MIGFIIIFARTSYGATVYTNFKMFLLDELEVRLYTMVSCCNTNTSMTTCGQRIRDILLKGVEADVSLPLALISLMFVSLSHPPCLYKNHETPKEKEKRKKKH